MTISWTQSLLSQRQGRFAMALLSGIANGIAFIWIGWLSLFANIPLLFALHASNRLSERVLLGGVVGFFAGLHIYGIAHYGWFLLITFSFYTASQMMIYGGLFHYLWPHLKKHGRLWLPVCLWVLTEWIRTVGSYSMPASYVGNIALEQWLSPWLFVAPLAGGLFVSGCVAMVQSTLFLALLDYTRYRLPIWSGCMMLSAIGILGICTTPSLGEKTVQVVGVQGGLHNSRYDAAKVDPLSREEVIRTFEHLTQQAYQLKPQLVIWPETAIRDTVLTKPKLAKRLFPNQDVTASLIAGLHRRREGQLYNAALAIEGGVSVSEVYKRKLVMGTEDHFSPGLTHLPLQTQYASVGVMICLEAVYGSIGQTLVSKGAELLVVMSNDAGFGYSPITHHMTRRAVIRALETGRWLVRVGQAGLSVMISPRGTITQELALFKPTLLRGEVGLRTDQTPFVQRPWLVPMLNHLCLSYLCVLALWRRRSRISSPNT